MPAPRSAPVRVLSRKAAGDTRQAFAELCERLGPQVQEATLPPVFDKSVDWHPAIMEADLAKNFTSEYAKGKDRLSASLRQMIERGQQVLAVEYNGAIEKIPMLNQALAEIFASYDAILTPAAMSVAPMGLDSTGSPIFCTIWTLCGTPSITLPILGVTGRMPIGAQLVAGRGDDARLVRLARWLEGWSVGMKKDS